MTRHHWPAVEAVGELIRTRKDQLDVDGKTIRLERPCLLAMLETNLIHASNTGSGGSSRGAGTSPVNTQALDLLNEIRYDAHSWARLLGVPTREYLKPITARPGKPTTPPLGRLLRACAVTAETTGRQPVADTITRLARRWARQIEEWLSEEPEQRDRRGAACPDCGASHVTEQRDDVNQIRDDGLGTFHTPAVAIVIPHDKAEEPSAYCRACGWQDTLANAAGITAEVVATTATRPDDHQFDGDAGQAA